MGELILVGTVHRDPEGYHPLLELLRREAPRLITVEVSPYALSFRLKRKELLEKVPGSVARFLEIPYEFRAAKDYGSKNGVPVLPIDLCTVSKRLLRESGRLLKGTHSSFKDDPSWGGHLSLARRCWEDPSLGRLFAKGLLPKRERALAFRIRKLLLRHPRKRLLHIGGWMHMIDAPYTLFWFLRDLAPRRLLLDPRDPSP